MTSERTLLLAMHRGSDRAGRALWSRHAGGLTRLARSITGDDGLADDLVQQAFCSVLSLDRPAVRAIKDPAAYLAASVRNAARLHARTEARRRVRESASRNGAAGNDDAGAPERPASLMSAIDALPIEMREVLVLRHQLQLTFDRLAEVLGEPRETVASRHRRALLKLRDLLAVEYDRSTPIPLGKGGQGGTT